MIGTYGCTTVETYGSFTSVLKSGCTDEQLIQPFIEDFSLIREFVGIHNVVTNLMRATDLPRLFCLFCGSVFLSHCLGLICL